MTGTGSCNKEGEDGFLNEVSTFSISGALMYLTLVSLSGE